MHERVNGKKITVRSQESKDSEVADRALVTKIMGYRYDYEITRHAMMRQIRIMHETVNDLVIELYGANPQHILFKECPKETKGEMVQEISKRPNRNNWGFGALPRNNLTF